MVTSSSICKPPEYITYTVKNDDGSTRLVVETPEYRNSHYYTEEELKNGYPEDSSFTDKIKTTEV